MSFRTLPWLPWLGLLGFAALLYAAGLGGGFSLDDEGNLAGLAGIADKSWADTAAYVLQGFAGPGGRPLSLLSFALQHEAWPDRPEQFKAVNLALHIVNASLVLCLALLIFRSRGLSSERPWIALFAAALWLLWPSQVSTVLYVVQRMSLLAASGMLAGLLLYWRAWQLWRDGRPLAAYACFAISWLVGMPLSMLFKENAAAYPLLALCLHLLNRGTVSPPRGWTAWLVLTALAPYLYLLFALDLDAAYASRDFSRLERLMSEPRVLWMYAGQILLPNPAAFPFHYDAMEPSRGVMAPPQTLWAGLGLMLALAIAVLGRHRWPLLSFALLFFLAAHALEASFVPLELAFEHRSYLASLGPAMGVAAGVAAVRHAFPQRRAVLGLLAGLYLLLISGVTYSLTQTWGDGLALSNNRLRLQPESRRAWTAHVEELRRRGAFREAAAIADLALARFPEDALLALQRAELGCREHSVQRESLAKIRSALQSESLASLGAVAALDRLSAQVEAGRCPAYSAEQLLALLAVARNNPAYAGRARDLDLMAGRLHASLGRTEEARMLLRRAVALWPSPDLLVQAASWELSQGNLEGAEHYITMLGGSGPLSLRARLAAAGDRERLQAWLDEMRRTNQMEATDE